MDATLYRSAFNPIIAEAHDACHGLYHPDDRRDAGAGQIGPADLRRRHGVRGQSGDRQGRATTAASPKAIPICSTTLMTAARICHDFRLVRPVFRGGEVFCWLASVGHWHDVGGNVPGNYNPRRPKASRKALLIPPVKLIAAACSARTSSISSPRIRACHSRTMAISTASSMRSDLGEQRLDALLDEYGDDTVSRPPPRNSPRARRH